MKTIKYNKDKTVLLDGKNLLTRIVDLKGGNWNSYTEAKNNNGKTVRMPNYPTFYKIGDYYYV